MLDERTESAWNVLAQCRKDGMDLDQAQEFALPYILLPDEKSEEQTDET